MAQTIKALLIEDNRIEARRTQLWLDGSPFAVESVDRLKLGLECLAKGGFDVVILDLNLPDSRGVATFDRLYAEIPDIPIVVLTGEFDEGIGSATVAKGAQDYLVKQRADGASLLQVLSYAIARHKALQGKLRSLQTQKAGRVLGFFGAKGGVGTTTVAINVAVALALQGKSVIHVELRPSFGTLSLHVGIQPERNLQTLLELSAEQIQRHDLDAVLHKGPAGVSILFGPKENEHVIQQIDSQKAESIIKGLSQMAEFVILDLPSQPSGANQAAANLCHLATVITEREPGSVRAGRAMVKQLSTWGVRSNSASGVVLVGAIIVNRALFTNYVMNVSEIQSQMECKVIGLVPYEPTANLRAIIKGVPVVVLLPESDASMSLTEIANGMTMDNVPVIQNGSGFALLKTPASS